MSFSSFSIELLEAWLSISVDCLRVECTSTTSFYPSHPAGESQLAHLSHPYRGKRRSPRPFAGREDRPAEHERGGPDSRSSLDQVSEDVEIPPMRRNKSKRIAFVSFVKASEAKAPYALHGFRGSDDGVSM